MDTLVKLKVESQSQKISEMEEYEDEEQNAQIIREGSPSPGLPEKVEPISQAQTRMPPPALHIRSSPEANGQPTFDGKSPLPPFDWEDFKNRQISEIKRVDDKENELVVEFEHLAQGFSSWAQSAAQFDNTRGFKRLKTRERYVELSSQSAAEKEQHYISVVNAFQKAFEMLR